MVFGLVPWLSELQKGSESRWIGRYRAPGLGRGGGRRFGAGHREEVGQGEGSGPAHLSPCLGRAALHVGGALGRHQGPVELLRHMVSGQDPMEGSIIQVLQWSKGVHEGLWKSLESFFFEFRLTGHLRRGSQQLRVRFRGKIGP